MTFIVRNPNATSFDLFDDEISLSVGAGEAIDLEAIFSHEQLCSRLNRTAIDEKIEA